MSGRNVFGAVEMFVEHSSQPFESSNVEDCTSLCYIVLDIQWWMMLSHFHAIQSSRAKIDRKTRKQLMHQPSKVELLKSPGRYSESQRRIGHRENKKKGIAEIIKEIRSWL